jgi:hypothetical protein
MLSLFMIEFFYDTFPPQVNSGVKEVARVFLVPGNSPSDCATGGDDEQSPRPSKELINLLKVGRQANPRLIALYCINAICFGLLSEYVAGVSLHLEAVAG